MPLFSTRPGRRPRLSRSLGDTQLDRVLGKVSKRGSGKAADVELIGELLVQDFTRKGFIDGRSVRVPTATVRPGKPNGAASGFASASG